MPHDPPDAAPWWVQQELPIGRLSPPRSATTWLARPRLLVALDGLGEHSVMLVIAPAGAGKSVAVAQWLAARAQPHAWLSLTGLDADPGTLVRDTVGALAEAGLVPRPSRLPPSHEPVDASAWWLQHVVLPLGHDGPPATLVLDDVHALPPSPGAEALALLLRERPPRLRLLLVGRQLPPLRLARLEAAGAVGRLPASLLWLVPEESEALLRPLLGPTSTPAERAELHARSEGWPAALRLLASAHALRGEASTRRALDFVIEEVIDAQPLGHRELLLDTAVVERITPALCAALTGQAEVDARLWELVETGLMMAVGQGAGFVTHPLLRAALLRRLEADEPARLRALHGRACEWLAANGQLDEAHAHALAAGDPARLVELVATHGFTLLRARRLGRLRCLLEAIPAAIRGSSPLLGTLDAWAALSGSPLLAREAMQRARAALERAPDPTLQASLDALELFVALRLGEPVPDLDARLAPTAALPTGLAVAVALGAGLAAERSDDLPLALARLERGMALAAAARPPLPSGITALAHRVRVLRRMGKCEQARREGLQGMSDVERHGWSAWPVAAELRLELAMVDLDEGCLPLAEAGVMEGLHGLRLGDDPATVVRGLLGLAMVRRARGDHVGATDAAVEAEAVARDRGLPFLVTAAQALLPPPRPAPAPSQAVAATEHEPLSPRELEVLELVAQGASNRLVARRLFISPVTVKTHMHNVSTKLGARNRTEAVHRARARGLLP
jgi:LuxR family maltose regulon positive regulatory protein